VEDSNGNCWLIIFHKLAVINQQFPLEFYTL
jgi:hypothetical protein